MFNSTLKKNNLFKTGLLTLACLFGCGGVEPGGQPDPSQPVSISGPQSMTPESNLKTAGKLVAKWTKDSAASRVLRQEEVPFIPAAADNASTDDATKAPSQQTTPQGDKSPRIEPQNDAHGLRPAPDKGAISKYGKSNGPNAKNDEKSADEGVVAAGVSSEKAAGYQKDRLNEGALGRWGHFEPQVEPQFLRLCNGSGLTFQSEKIRRYLTTGYTIEFWLKLDERQDLHLLEANGLRVDLRNFKVVASLGSTIAEGLEIDDRQWVHVAVTVDENELSLFVNGSPTVVALEREATADKQGRVIFTGAEKDLPQLCVDLDNIQIFMGKHYSGAFFPRPTIKIDDKTLVTYDFDDTFSAVVKDQTPNGVDGRLSGYAYVEAGRVSAGLLAPSH